MNPRLSALQPMPNTRDNELAVGRALAKAYPWLFKVERMPGAGLIGAPGYFHGFEAANFSAIDPVPG